MTRSASNIQLEIKGAAGARAAFPDILHTFEGQIAERGMVSTRYAWSGALIGEFMEIAPTEKKVTFAFSDI